MAKGKLYLIPTPLGEEVLHTIPEYVKDIIGNIDFFIVEKAKTARRFIKKSGTSKPIPELTFYELNKRTVKSEIFDFLKPLEEGKDMGMMSEAGSPGVADPGAIVVRLAHRLDIEVVPLVGPTSILMALMASGMNGQHFAFVGYLSPKRNELAKGLRKLEQQTRRNNQTQIFIETPYRNKNVIETALHVLAPETYFCVAADISLPTEFIKTKKIKDWRKTKLPDLHKRPAIFLIN